MQALRMKQPRRYRWLKLSVFLIVYSVFHSVLSAPSEPEQGAKPDIPADPAKPEETRPIKPAIEENIEQKKENEEKEQIVKEEKSKIEDGKEPEEVKATEEEKSEKEVESGGDKNKLKGKTKLSANTTEIPIANELTTRATLPNVPPTLRAKRENCTPPAIEQFPNPLIGPYARRHGAVIIHVLIAVFTFVGLAIICDEYFVSSLDRICEELKMAPDVAGATFMAAGSSAPELATVIIGVFFAKDDIGVSGVIGSAVFNIMFVISVCALCAGTVSHLNWWPLCRDCFFYAISILVMLCTIWDGLVYWYEAFIMLLMYVVYCVALHFNSSLERLAISLPLPFKLPTREEQAALVTYKSAVGEKGLNGAEQYAQVDGTTQETPLQNTGYSADGTYENVAYNAEPPAQEWDPNRSWGEDQPQVNQAPVWDPSATWSDSAHSAPSAAPVSAPAAAPAPAPPPPAASQVAVQPGAPVQNYYRPKEQAPGVNPLEKPVDGNPWQMLCWGVAYPVHWSARKTMPDCRGPWYPATFIISMLWICFYSYFMVWMITIIGATLNIPDTVMGLTFVAAGVSVPDALSSLAVIKEGYGDMAVSNAVGSNVFDILVCLGLPWFIQTTMIRTGSAVNVISKGLVYSTLSLFSTVVFLVLATHANGWKLDRKYGIILMVWYLLFITFASLYELNVFGNFHPPDCYSNY